MLILLIVHNLYFLALLYSLYFLIFVCLKYSHFYSKQNLPLFFYHHFPNFVSCLIYYNYIRDFLYLYYYSCLKIILFFLEDNSGGYLYMNLYLSFLLLFYLGLLYHHCLLFFLIFLISLLFLEFYYFLLFLYYFLIIFAFLCIRFYNCIYLYNYNFLRVLLKSSFHLIFLELTIKSVLILILAL